MRMRWLTVVVVVLLVMGSALLRSHPTNASIFGDAAARTHAAAPGDALSPVTADGQPALPGAALAPAGADVLLPQAAHSAAADALATTVAQAPGATQQAGSPHGAVAGTAARRTASSSHPDDAAGAQSAAAPALGTSASVAAGSAPAGGVAAGGLQARPTIVKSTAGTATIYNAQIEVGFVFDPSDNPNHRLQFNGPDVAKSEFTLHGDAVSDVTIDGQQAVAGHWYPLHAGLTLTAVAPIAVHVRAAAPKSDG